MTGHRTSEYPEGLVQQLRALPHETEWVEFKCNDAESAQIGEYISAVSNSAALLGKPHVCSTCATCRSGRHRDEARLLDRCCVEALRIVASNLLRGVFLLQFAGSGGAWNQPFLFDGHLMGSLR